MKKIKHPFKGILIVFLILLLILGAALLLLTAREYRPAPVEKLEHSSGSRTISPEDSLTLVTYNTGYAGLDKTADFFMDGGHSVQPDSAEQVKQNMEGIGQILSSNPADVYFLQEVDLDSKRSFHINEKDYYENILNLPGLFAMNFNCDYVPYPLPPIGKVKSGIHTLTDLTVKEASRISLPESFTWPVKTCNLKRCMLETRIPLKGTDAQLVLINFHLEAYDSGEGKIAQSKMLAEKLEKEYHAGNYVIAGGDFNQTFDKIASFPVVDNENWVPGVFGSDSLPEHFSVAADDAYPTCRLLNAPYTGSYDTSQVYVIDGFIVSDNLKVSDISVINTDFEYTDHQPVKMTVEFQ